MAKKKTRKELKPLEYTCTILCFTSRVWTATKMDRALTERVASGLNTNSDWGSFQKRLVAKSVVADITKLVGQARNYLKGDSPGIVDGQFIPGGLPPWDKKGRSVLPNALNDTVLKNMAAYKEKYEELWKELRVRLPSARQEAKHEAGDAYNESDILNFDNILDEKFSFEFKEEPIPSGDVRCEMSKTWKDNFQKKQDRAQEEKVEEITSHALSTSVGVLSHFAEACENYDEGNKRAHSFRDSSVAKVKELIPVVRALNVAKDARIEKIANECEKVLGGVTAEEFRTSGDKRKDAAKKARDLSSNIDKMFS